MRVKSRWFKNGREKTPQEIAGALAFILWRISDNALKNLRKADFSIDVGPQYINFLGEFVIFMILLADRIVYERMTQEERAEFTSALANRVAENFAENRTLWLGGDLREVKDRFIDRLNERSGEYAQFEYAGVETSFTFILYFGQCMREVMHEKDQTWVVDQLMAIEVPEAVKTLEKALIGLFEEEGEARPRRSSASGD
ncbi:MAG TPA: hypothetical protein VIU93_09900 [Gallionellaceae bacterium]